MPILDTDLLLRLSGGAGNTDPDLALGGIMSTTTAISPTVSEENLFNNFTAAETTAGSTKYRGLYLLNNHGTISLTASAVYIPTVKSNTIKFRIPIFWVNKLNIKLDLPVWYQIVYEKKLFTHSISEKKIKIPISIGENISIKLNTFLENTLNIFLKPDFRVEKLKNLSKLKKLLNMLEKID